MDDATKFVSVGPPDWNGAVPATWADAVPAVKHESGKVTQAAQPATFETKRTKLANDSALLAQPTVDLTAKVDA